MKRFIALVLLVVFTLCLTGCMEEETVPEEKNLEVLSTLQGSVLRTSKFFSSGKELRGS